MEVFAIINEFYSSHWLSYLFCVDQLNRMATTTGSKAFMSYVAEGLGDVLDWDEAAMVYQRQNGSFFNSPATTAAAAIHSNNDRALRYLDSLVSMFGSSGAKK